MMTNASEWAETIMIRTLNSEPDRNNMINLLAIATPTIQSLTKSMLEKIVTESKKPLAGRVGIVLQSLED